MTLRRPRIGRLSRSVRGFWLALLYLAFFPVATVQAAGFLSSTEVLRDAGGTLSIDEVAQARFMPLEGVLSAGYTDDVHWLRLVVRPRADGGAVKLRIRPTFLDDIQLFEPDPGRPGHWLKRVGGDRQPSSDTDRGINSLGFLVHPQAPASTYFLRLQTSSTSLLHVQALSPAEAARKDSRVAIWNFVYLALLLWIVVWGIQDFAQYRQKVVGAFVLYQTVNVLYTLALMGYLTAFEPDGWTGFSDRLTSLLVILIASSGIFFHKTVLQPYRPNPWLMRGMDILLVLTLTLPLAYFAGWQRLALQSNALAALLVSVLMLLLPFSARQEGAPSLRYIRTLYVVLGCSQLLFLLPFLGLSDAVEWTLQSTLMHGLFMAMLMFYMLLQRSRLLRQELETRSQQAMTAQLQLARERTHAESLGRFIDMLTHEIKTPLAVAVMNLGALRVSNAYMDRIRRALGNIDSIIERTRLSELAEHRRLQPQMSLSNVSELVYECIETSAAPERIQASVEFALEARTDPGLITIIVSNLIDNALKYSAPGHLVELSLEGLDSERGRHLVLHVVNTAGTTGPLDAEKLFEKFYRGASAYSQSGSGLGLYLSRNLAELLGGRLDYQPREGVIEFALWLPA